MLTPSLLNLLGIEISGDLGDLTLFRDRFGKLISFQKSPPNKPASALQQAQRARFQCLVRAWTSLPESQRAAYELASRSLSLMCTGHNVWMHVGLTGAYDELATIARLSKQSLEPPPTCEPPAPAASPSPSS